MKVIKRNGAEVEFDKERIIVAISKAKDDTTSSNISETQIKEIADYIEFKCNKLNRAVDIEEIQDMVEKSIMGIGQYELAQNYVRYRHYKALRRKSSTTYDKIINLCNNTNEEVLQENANKNPTILATQRDYIAGEVSKDLTFNNLLPKHIADADREGIIKFHDPDYFIERAFNCCLVNLEDMLQNGTVISKTRIDKPKSFSVACNIATQIMAQVASNQYGGQTISLTHLAPFVDVSRQKIKKEVEEELKDVKISKAKINQIVESRLVKEIDKGVQTIQYQILTLSSVNGQAPFVSLFCYLNEAKTKKLKKDLAMVIEAVLHQRIRGVKNEAGVYISPSFPKILYVLEEDNITEESSYWYLTELAAKCTAKRMVPDYISEKIMKEEKEGNCFPSMGCRSFLMPWKDSKGKYKFYGRFNQGVVTLNLVDVALSSNGDYKKFWDLMEERTNLCKEALMLRHERLKGVTSDYSPIHWQYGAIARLKPGETIDKFLYGNYSSISLGYAGLYECVKYMTGVSHTETKKGKPFGIKIMKYLRDRCNEWQKETNIGFSLYGTPIENATYKFAKTLQKRFGVIKGITDHNYVTNSYHVTPSEKIDIFSKFKFESEFQKYSSGGQISYGEIPNMEDNIPALLSVIKYIYNVIMYAEFNTKLDYCHECGWDKEIVMIEENGKLRWKCPNCGNTDLNKMTIVRRVCGYLSSNTANQGRMADIRDRVLHL